MGAFPSDIRTRFLLFLRPSPGSVGFVMLSRAQVVIVAGLVLAACDHTPPESFDLGDHTTPIAGFDPARPTVTSDDPESCADAATHPSYLGCSFWPTAVANGVLPAFDFAVLVANPGVERAEITVTGPGGYDRTFSLAPGALEKIYLPWVESLYPLGATCETSPELETSRLGVGAAFHLVSSRPVIASQWNPLQYKAAGLQKPDADAACIASCGSVERCFAVSNDASLLLPDTALTGRYRVIAHARGAGNYVAITATHADTQVTVTLGARAHVLAGPDGSGLASAWPNDTLTLTLHAGDVAELVGDGERDWRGDLSGSVIEANHPVQVIAGDICVRSPDKYPYSCDHIEELQLPRETLGRRYVVPGTTGPDGTVVPHFVRLVGEVDRTALAFEPPFEGAPTSIDAGEVISLPPIQGSFYVEGDQPFAIATFQLSASFVDSAHPPEEQRGDPSASFAIPIEQFRTRAVIVAPDDYESAFADVVLPLGATLTIDGQPVVFEQNPIGASAYTVAHVRLATANGSAHCIDSDQPIGVQALGYGLYTSYQLPGAMNAKRLP